MKKIILTKYGPPEVLQVHESANPKPSDDQIKVKLSYSGINFAEIMARMRLYPGAPKPPSVLGAEGSGIIDEIGKNVTGFHLGQKVMFFTMHGSYSSHVCLDPKLVMTIPDNFDLKDAAAFPVIYFTAYMMLFDLGNLMDKDTILIHGGGGGVGTAAIQLASTLNVKIITTASHWKHEKLFSLGASHCIDYYKDDIIEKVMKFTNNEGADLIIDPVGSKNWKKSYKLLNKMGKLIIYGNQNLVSGYKINLLNTIRELMSMPKYRPMNLMSSNKNIMGFHLGRLRGAEWKIQRALIKLKDLIIKNDIRPVIDKVFNFEDAPAAHRYIQDKKNFGKVLLDFSSVHNQESE